MRAMLLAAGKGERLAEAKAFGSKVLVPVNGKPILEWNLRFLKRKGFRQAVINVCGGGKEIEAFLRKKKSFGLSVKISYERVPLGTAGGVKKAEKFLGKKDFLVLYGDNLYDFDIAKLRLFHQKNKAIATLGVFHPGRTKHSGILAGFVKLGKQGRVEKFIEKRNNQRISKRGFVNAGIAVFSPEIFRMIPSRRFSDFAKDVYPKILRKKKRFFGAEGANYVLASDTDAALRRTRHIAKKIL